MILKKKKMISWKNNISRFLLNDHLWASMLRPLLASLTGLSTLQGERIKVHFVQTIQPCLKRKCFDPICHIRCSTFCINQVSTVPWWDTMEGGITALEKALGPSLDSILLSRPVTFENSWCVMWRYNDKDYLSAFFCLLQMGKGYFLFSFHEFLDSDPLFFDTLTVRWQLGRVRGSQFLANLSSPQITLHVFPWK